MGGLGLSDLDFRTWTFGLGLSDLDFRTWTFGLGLSDLDFRTWNFGLGVLIIMVRQILTKNSFKSGNGLVISPLLRDFLAKFRNFRNTQGSCTEGKWRGGPNSQLF